MTGIMFISRQFKIKNKKYIKPQMTDLQNVGLKRWIFKDFLKVERAGSKHNFSGRTFHIDKDETGIQLL